MSRGNRAVLRGTLSVLIATLVVSPVVSSARAAQAGGAPGLEILIVDGQGAINNIPAHTGREPVVQVQDENHRPVPGAVVMFSLPERGAGGTFANGGTTMTATTDAQGRAVGSGLRPNNVQGSFQLRVSASYQGQTASAVIDQTNSLGAAAAGSGRMSGKTLGIILAVAGGAAAGGILAATHGGSSSSSAAIAPGTTPTTVAIGTPTVSPPH
jgi:hypothetical protein